MFCCDFCGVFKSFSVFKQQLSDLSFTTLCDRIHFKEFLWTYILGRLSVDNTNLVTSVLLQNTCRFAVFPQEHLYAVHFLCSSFFIGLEEL